MYFSAEYPGPFWLSTKERERMRHDVLLSGTKTKRLARAEMLAALQGKGVVASGKAKDLKILCDNNGKGTIILKQKKGEGWEGKLKGMLQILWEQGWIDPQ
jgi:hypothetical protein